MLAMPVQTNCWGGLGKKQYGPLRNNIYPLRRYKYKTICNYAN